MVLPYKFGELFSFEYIDGDTSEMGGILTYVNCTMLTDINPMIRTGYTFDRALLDMNTGVFSFYRKYGDGVATVYTIGTA
jgi:hypothetical protein